MNFAKILDAKQATILTQWIEENNLSEDQFKLGDSKLSGSHALMIKERQVVALKAKGVRSADGLAALHSLRNLEVSFFEKIQFKQCPPQLKSLRINGLPTKPLSLDFLTQCPNLTELQLFYTNITDWQGLYTLNHLQNLSIRHSDLSSFQLTQSLPALQRLDLSDNKISSLSLLVTQQQLKALFLSNNQLSLLPDLSSLTALETLSLDNNPLLAVAEGQLPPLLKNLDVRTTMLMDFNPLLGLKNLQRVQVQRTPKSLPAALADKVVAAINEDSQLSIAEDLMEKYLGGVQFIEKLPKSVDGKALGLHKESSQHFGLDGTSKLSGTIIIDELQGLMRMPLAQTDNLLYTQRQVLINGEAQVSQGVFRIYSPVELDFWQIAAVFVDHPQQQAPESSDLQRIGFIVHEVRPRETITFQANLIPMADRYLLLIGGDTATGIHINYE